MTDTFKNAFAGVKSGWEKITTKQKRILIGVVLAVGLLAITMGISGSRVNHALLFSNLELADAGAIVSDLESRNIKYSLQDGGRTILIDEKMVDTYRMDLAMNNMLPDSSTGFEIFDNTGLMVTDEDRQIMYQRALTGELQRTISSIDGINSAKVHLVIPQKSIFDTETRNSSASVVIDVKPGHNVSEPAVRGIAAMVSGAVDNMPIENIQVIDSSGHLLSGFLVQGSSHDLATTVGQYSAARASFEKEIEGKLITLLGGAYGYDKLKVSVLADLDFNSEESTIISYSDPVVRSEQVAAAGGELDYQQVTGGNIDDNISNVIEGAGDDQSTYTRITNNELTTETTNIIKAPGQVRKLTTSIVYEGELTEGERASIQSIVAAAIGYDGERGDLISVVGVAAGGQAESPGPVPGAEGPESFFQANRVPILIGSGVLGLLLIGLTIILLVRRSKRKQAEEREFQKRVEQGITIDDAFEEIEDIVVRPDQKGTKAQKYAHEHPELAAELIKSWIRE